jgi:hypothetical protein
LNVSLSKNTDRFLGFRPRKAEQSSFEKFGVSYYFFTDTEMAGMFTRHGFTLVEQRTEDYDARTDPGDSVTLLFSLFKL